MGWLVDPFKPGSKVLMQMMLLAGLLSVANAATLMMAPAGPKQHAERQH